MSDEPIPIGKLGRAHGTKGEVRLWLDNPESEILYDGLEVVLLTDPPPPDEEDEEPPFHRGDVLQVEGWRQAAKFVILQLAGVTDRQQARMLRNIEIGVAREDFPELDEDEFYRIDLIGFDVLGRQSEADPLESIGTLETFLDNVDLDIMVVTGPRLPKERMLIPMLEHVVEEIDVEAETVTVAPLDAWAPEDDKLTS